MMKKLFKLIENKNNQVVANPKGFSLIEMIVVLAIIVVLAGVSIPVYTVLTDRAEYSALQAQIVVYRDAARAAVADLGVPEDDIVWGDSIIEEDAWAETLWLTSQISDDFLVTIHDNGRIEITIVQESINYDKYMQLIEKYGDINTEVSS